MATARAEQEIEAITARVKAANIEEAAQFLPRDTVVGDRPLVQGYADGQAAVGGGLAAVDSIGARPVGN